MGAGGGVDNHQDMVISVRHSRMIHSGGVNVLSVTHTKRLVSKWSQKENVINANVAVEMVDYDPRRLHQTPACKLVPGLAGVLAARRRRSSGLFIEP